MRNCWDFSLRRNDERKKRSTFSFLIQGDFQSASDLHWWKWCSFVHAREMHYEAEDWKRPERTSFQRRRKEDVLKSQDAWSAYDGYWLKVTFGRNAFSHFLSSPFTFSYSLLHDAHYGEAWCTAVNYFFWEIRRQILYLSALIHAPNRKDRDCV